MTKTTDPVAGVREILDEMVNKTRARTIRSLAAHFSEPNAFTVNTFGIVCIIINDEPVPVTVYLNFLADEFEPQAKIDPAAWQNPTMKVVDE